MDDKRKRELSAAVERGLDDATVQKLVANDAQAKAYLDGLVAVDRALRAWPVKEPSGVDAFVDSVLARLDESPRDEFDPLAAPFADEREQETPRRNHSEHQAMSQSKDQDNEDDLEGLAALMRPSRTGSSASVPPPPVSLRPGPALTDDAMDESSGIVDIKHLAAIAKRASIPPAAEAPPKSEPAEPAAEAKADAKKADEGADAKDGKKAEPKADAKKGDAKKSDAKDAKADAKKGDKAEAGATKKSAEASEKKAQPVPAATASESAEPKKGTSPVVWIGVIGIAAAGAFYMGRSGNQSTPAVNAEQAPQTVAAPSSSAGSAAQPSAPLQGARPTVAEQTASGASAPTPPAVGAPVAANNAAPTGAQAAEPPTQPALGAAAQPTEPSAATTPTQAPTTGSTIGATGAAFDQAARPTTTGASSTGESERAARRTTNTASGSGASAEPRGNSEGRPSAAEPTRPPGNAAASPTRPPAAQTPAAAPTTTTASAPTNAPRGGAAGGTAPTAPAATAAAAPTGRARSVEELMRAATGADRAEAVAAQRNQTAAAQSAALPPQLTTTMVRSTMGPFNSQVRACAQGQTGSATAVITVGGDGAVQNVVVSSPWGSGPNECISNRLRTARFPAVQRATSRVVVPFQINPSQPGG